MLRVFCFLGFKTIRISANKFPPTVGVISIAGMISIVSVVVIVGGISIAQDNKRVGVSLFI
jgi:hypothetical protein